jgi:leucyl-tRNA synthetase
VWRLVHEVAPILKQPADRPGSDASQIATDLKRLAHKTIKKVSDDIEREFQFNTAIAALMELVNGLYKIVAEVKDTTKTQEIAALREAIETLLLLLSPFAPHIAGELWTVTGHTTSLARERWPVYDAALIREEVLTIPVQVNGKVRSKLTVPAEWSKEQVLAASLSDLKVSEWIKGKTIKNKVYVEKRLVNIVVEG